MRILVIKERGLEVIKIDNVIFKVRKNKRNQFVFDGEYILKRFLFKGRFYY